MEGIGQPYRPKPNDFPMGACRACGGANGFVISSGELWGVCTKHGVRWKVPGELGRHPDRERYAEANKAPLSQLRIVEPALYGNEIKNSERQP